MIDFNEPATASVTAVINILPIGTIIPYSGTAERIVTLDKQGWLLCNGACLVKDKYPKLYEVIGNSCGAKFPEFCLPDLRGMFLRGVDGEGENSRDPDNKFRTRQGSGERAPNGVLTRQDDDVKPHSHEFPERAFSDRVFQGKGGGEYYFRVIEPKNGTTHESTGSETRPVNVSVNYIIFAGLPVS